MQQRDDPEHGRRWLFSDEPSPIFQNVLVQAYNSSTIDPANLANYRIANLANNTTFGYGRASPGLGDLASAVDQLRPPSTGR